MPARRGQDNAESLGLEQQIMRGSGKRIWSLLSDGWVRALFILQFSVWVSCKIVDTTIF